MKYGKGTLEEYRNGKDVRNAFINIYLILTENTYNDIKVSANEICIESDVLGKETLNIIRLNEKIITVSYYEKRGMSFQLIKANTPILKEVEGFEVIKKGEILYIEIRRRKEVFLKYI